MDRIELPEYDTVGIRADNPSRLTLQGTNTWIVGRGPAWVVDPGPALDSHLEALTDELERRGGLAGIALTHDHVDHAQATAPLRQRFPAATLAAARGEVDVALEEGSRFGPLTAMRTPGHSPDHLAYVHGRAGFTGDAVLGEGSVFIAPDPGALAAYLDALASLRRRRLAILCPGHGPVIDDPQAKLDQYVAHRLEREQRLVSALSAGHRTVAEMLDAAWSDAPAALRPAAAATLAAHLDKLADEGRLPEGVERP
ncbi:MAG: MBL fold metallo-hydrolase [Solirubrobacterales bacterium]|nr:MBL fold metallo-hydrolase [Solirubrobacterales bacterium]